MTDLWDVIETALMFDAERTKDAEARFRRLEKLFRSQARFWGLVNRLLDEEGEQFKVKDGEDRDLSLLVSASLGKAMKTFFGVYDLCLAGWGEDALLLVRSNINLLINLAYILSDAEPRERAADFIAFSYLARVDYLRAAHGIEEAPWKPTDDPQTIKMRATRWASVGIKARAEGIPTFPKFHYVAGYTLYSSIEHSDAMALSSYIAEWDEVGPRINAGPSDDHIEVALGHSAMVLADIVMLWCAYFKIDRPDIQRQLRDLVKAITE